MKKLLITAQWNELDLTKSWSGTSFQLYNNLKKIREVERLITPNTPLVSALSKVNSKCFKYTFALKKLILKLGNDNISKQINDKSLPVLSIGAIRAFDNPTYIYVDNLFCSCLLLKTYQKEGWGYNPWGNLNDNCINQAIKYEHKIIQKAKAVFCMGEWLTELAKETYKDCSSKIYFAPGGINSFTSQQNIQKDTNMVLFVGRDFKRKAGDIVFKAVKYLNEKKSRNIKLFIVGPKEYPLNEHYNWINYLGDVSYDEVGILMKQANLFCMPSRFEAYGLVFAEALLAETPCIGRDAFEMPYFIEEGKTGELLRFDDYQELSNKIEKILSSPNYIKNIINNKANILNKYNWEKTAKLINNTIA